MVGDFNTLFIAMDRTSRQKINKATEILNDTTEKSGFIVLNFKDITSKKKKKTPEYTLFASTQGTFSRMDHILGHKTNLNKFKCTKIISSIFSDLNGMKLEINYRKRNEKKNDYVQTK